jgi:hypothetical protein
MTTATKEEKSEKQPTTPEEITIELTLKKCRSSEGGSGSMHLKIADTCVEIKVGEERVGSVDARMGGGFEICVYPKVKAVCSDAYFVSSVGIWNQVVTAIDRTDLVIEKKGKK